MGAQRANLSTVCGILSLVFCFVFPQISNSSSGGNKPSTVAPEMVFLIYPGKSLNRKTNVSDMATELIQSTIVPNSES